MDKSVANRANVGPGRNVGPQPLAKLLGGPGVRRTLAQRRPDFAEANGQRIARPGTVHKNWAGDRIAVRHLRLVADVARFANLPR